jgi:hypothetical protein
VELVHDDVNNDDDDDGTHLAELVVVQAWVDGLPDE